LSINYLYILSIASFVHHFLYKTQKLAGRSTVKNPEAAIGCLRDFFCLSRRGKSVRIRVESVQIRVEWHHGGEVRVESHHSARHAEGKSVSNPCVSVCHHITVPITPGNSEISFTVSLTITTLASEIGTSNDILTKTPVFHFLLRYLFPVLLIVLPDHDFLNIFFFHFLNNFHYAITKLFD
jgi:hypothetical protein